MKIVTCRPDINKSGTDFIIDEVKFKGKTYEVIRSPFTVLKGIGKKAVEEIVDKKPFSGLKDFLSRVDGRKVTSKVFEVLLDGGCFDDAWNVPRSQLKSQYKNIKEEISKEKKAIKKQQEKMDEFKGSLFDGF